MVLLRHSDISNAWKSVKKFVGNGWHTGTKIVGAMDRYADLGIRLLGAASPMLPNKALSIGLSAANEYNRARNRVGDFKQQVDYTTQRFKKAVPELDL